MTNYSIKRTGGEGDPSGYDIFGDTNGPMYEFECQYDNTKSFLFYVTDFSTRLDMSNNGLIRNDKKLFPKDLDIDEFERELKKFLLDRKQK